MDTAESCLPTRPSRPPSQARSPWPLLIVLAVVQFTHVLDSTLLLPLAPNLMSLFEIGPGGFGLLVSSYNLSAAAAGLFGAFTLDRFDRKSALIFVYVGFICGTMACALSLNATTLFLARMAAGASGGLLQALLFAIIGDCFKEGQRGAATGTVMSAFSFASIIGIPIALILAERYSWRAPFFALGLISLAVLPPVFKVIPPLREHLKDLVHSHVARRQARVRGTFEILFKTNTLAAFGLIVSLMFAGFTVIPFMSVYLVRNVGLGETDLATVFLVAGVATFLTTRLVGHIADRFGKPRVFTWLALLSIAPTLALTHLAPASLVTVLLVTTSFTVMISARGIPALAMITSSVDRTQRGRFLSFTSAVQQASSGLASLVAGAVLGQSSSGAITRFAWVGYLASGAAILAIFASRSLRVPGRQAGTSASRLRTSRLRTGQRREF